MATRKKAPAVLSLPERFTVEHAADVLAEARACAGKSGKVTLDLGGVRTVDTAGMQLLAVVCRQMKADGRDLELKSAPELIGENARLLGLDELLELA